VQDVTQHGRGDDCREQDDQQIAHSNFGRVHQALKTLTTALIKRLRCNRLELYQYLLATPIHRRELRLKVDRSVA
jgi:hypothetical protein